MIKRYYIMWSWSYNDTWYFDKYREWFVIVTKEYNHSRLVDLKKALKTKAFPSFR